MNTKTKNILFWSIFASAFLIILSIGTMFDLQISKALADVPSGQYLSSNFFAIFFEIFGEYVLYILLIFALGVLFFYLIKKPLQKKWLNICLLIAICIVSFGVCLYSFNKLFDYIDLYANFKLSDYLSSTIGKITIVAGSIVINVLSFLGLSFLKEETLTKLWKWAVVVLIVALLSNAFVQITKRIVCRTRFRAMLYVGDSEFSHFTNWFTINKDKLNFVSYYADDFFKSFPSGHTCAGASIFLIVLLPLFFTQLDNKKWKSILWTTASVYTFIVALSRIIAGAHFFTDVFVGGMVTITLTLIAYFICKKHFYTPPEQTTCMKRGKRYGC